MTVYGRPGSVSEDDPYLDPRVKSIQTPGLESKSLSTLSYGFTSTLHCILHTKPDVAIVMNVANGFFLPLLSARRIPTLVNVDGIEWDRAKWGRAAKLMFRTGARLTAKFGSELVYDARAIERYWGVKFGRNGEFIPYGGTDPGKLSSPLELPSGGYALIVARFVPENTVPEFLEAAREISEHYPVVIVGSSGWGGPLDQAAGSLASEHAQVQWLGHVSDDELLFALLQHAGAYFHGHSVGGTNPALVQAMACGAPIVARDTIYNREVLGDGATFVAPNPPAIAKAIRRMIASQEEQQKAAKNARARAQSKYTWEIVCVAYEKAIMRLFDTFSGSQGSRRQKSK